MHALFISVLYHNLENLWIKLYDNFKANYSHRLTNLVLVSHGQQINNVMDACKTCFKNYDFGKIAVDTSCSGIVR